MNRYLRGAFALAIATGIVTAGAATAVATPGKSTTCSSCHSGTTLSVSASESSNDGTLATYKVSSAGAYAIAVFKGSTKIAVIYSSSGSFSVPVGSTYKIYAVKGPSTSSGIGTKSVSPVAAAADTTAPVTTSDAVASYAGAATVRFTPKDNSGGTGVAATYYMVDGGATVAGVVVVVGAAGTHTVAFWSVDKAGNVESPPKTATFVVGDALPTQLSLGTSARTIKYGSSAVLTGRLVGVSALAAKRVVLQYSTDNKTWKSSSAVYTTDYLGEVRMTVAPTTRRYYRIRFAGDSGWMACVGTSLSVTPRVYLTRPKAPTSIKRGSAFTSYGFIKPRHKAGTYPVKIKCYRYQSGKWVLRKSVYAKASDYSAYSKYSRRMSLPYAGQWRIRAYHAADSKNAATYSSYRYVSIK